MQTPSLEERFASFIRSKHLRKTAERFAILHKVETLHDHFDAETLRQAMEKEGYHVSRSTVYNTVELLCQCGILRRLTFDPHQAHYELAERNHLHLVCTVCGEVRDVDDEVVESHMAALRYPAFSASIFSLTVYGTCARCQRRLRRLARAGKDSAAGKTSRTKTTNHKNSKS